jgi:surface antigen
MNRRYLLAAAALVVVCAGTAAASVTPGSYSHPLAPSAVPIKLVTTAPSFTRRRYRVRAGHAVTTMVRTHLAVNAKAEVCSLVVRRRGFRTRRFIHRDVQSDFLLTFVTARRVARGNWRVGVACQVPGQAWSRTAARTIKVTGRGAGHAALVSRHGPNFDGLMLPPSAGNGGAGVAPNPFQDGQCTYYAYERRPDIWMQSVLAPGAPKYTGWDAYQWSQNAAQYGHFQEGTTPAVGSIMVEPATAASPVGHVAYVSQVFDATHFVTQEMNTDKKGTPDKVFTVLNYWGSPGPQAGAYAFSRTPRPGTVFIYGGPVLNPPQYSSELGHIVQWSGDTKAQKTAWLVVDDGGTLRRHWIPSISVYWCLKNSGAPGPDVVSSSELDAMADENGVWATCTGNTNPGGGAGGGDGGSSTYTETEGHIGSNTFTDPTTATGIGARVSAGEQVQVACKVYAPQIASVNPDGYWYQIASAPWSGAYYAPANTFMNGDPWNGPYTHNTDYSVPDCSGSTTSSTTTSGTTTGPPPPPTWPETAGGVAHTWTDYSSAGGTEGPEVAAYQTVQIACSVQGFRVADGNTWWYRIAQAPWSDNYYVSADAFYNNGQTSGSLSGTPFVDPSVPAC